MKIDIDYIKLILDEFIYGNENYIENDRFESMIYDDFEKFSFHWDLLCDQSLLVASNNTTVRFIDYGNKNVTYGILIRLHNNGHTFYSALNDENFINKFKKSTTHFSMSILMKSASEYLENNVSSFINSL